MTVVGIYFAILAVAVVLLLMKLQEERKAYLVSPLDALGQDDRPPLVSLALRVVLSLAAFFGLVDLILLGFLLPPLMVGMVDDSRTVMPGLNRFHLLLNFVFDYAVIRIAVGGWRYRRGWQIAGVVIAGIGILAVAWIWAAPSASLARWVRPQMVASQRGELMLLGALFAAWLLLAGWTLLRPPSGPDRIVYRDEDLANKEEPLEPAERAQVRWARGEATKAERELLS